MNPDLQKRLLATFRTETEERIAALSAGLIAMEKAVERAKRLELLETVFREAHSLKGAARSVGMAGIESLSHAMEGLFVKLKATDGSAPSAVLFDMLHRAIDAVGESLKHLESGPDDALKARITGLVLGLEKNVEGAPPLPPPQATPSPIEQGEAAPSAKVTTFDTVRISSGKLDSVFHQAEEMLTARQAAAQRAAVVGEISAGLDTWEKEWKKNLPVLRGLRKARQNSTGRGTVNVDVAQLGRLLDFFESGHTVLKNLQADAGKLGKKAAADLHSFEVMVDNLLDDMKTSLMLPCAAILGLLPKMVRDLARDGGKEAELLVSGESLEIDKRVLEELKDPLIHLVRNCIDHGIEKPAERQRKNKPPCGRIAVSVLLVDSGRVEVVVSDDGAGIDAARLAECAIRGGFISRGEADRLGDGLTDLVFRSGVTTSPVITDISGRGLGLAIVREKVERLGGTVTVAGGVPTGTTFRMVLPLTISTFRGVLVLAGEHTFVVPAAGVERVLRANRSSVRTVENRETISIDGETASYVRLADVLRLPRKEMNGGDSMSLIVIRSGTARIAFGVDAVLDEREILVKSLGPQLPRVRNISGATVLGSGRVAAILHPGDLVKSAINLAAVSAGTAPPADSGETARKTLLVVEDSITARTLLKNILETAGYNTLSSVDGLDAMSRLRTEEIDLVISDVDMPRMNGFDLTAKIRATRELADLPVVLVTSLDSREDRERGIEAGANAYIVKSSFDQSNLLEVVKRLV